MCGIYGILNKYNLSINIYQDIIDSLIQLKNRGQDAVGICVINKNNFNIYKFSSCENELAINKLINLNLKIGYDDINIGIGHTRRATHGKKTDNNAHPHLSNDLNIVLVHNGIIENYKELKTFLEINNFVFLSETDSEVIVNLISYYNKNNSFINSLKKTINKIIGSYALIIINKQESNKLYCVRNESPILIGYNENSIIITSEQNGFCNKVNSYIALNNNDLCIISRENNELIIKTNDNYKERKIYKIQDNITLDLWPYWTIKEINEQIELLNKNINNNINVVNSLNKNINELSNIDNIILLGCGTSLHAGLYSMYLMKKYLNFNIVLTFNEADFQEIDIPKNGKTIFILISQTGENSDLYKCLKIAKNNNIFTIGVINVVNSLIAREVDNVIYYNIGIEMGTTSTKAFTCQVVTLSLIILWFSNYHNINITIKENIIRDLYKLSNDFKYTILNSENKIINIAKKINNNNYNNLYILGKLTDEYIAKQGSLNIKEISYIHSEAYSYSAFKHGLIALLNENLPVVIINTFKEQKFKIMSYIEEIKYRKSPLIFITNDNEDLNIDCDIIKVEYNETFNSLLSIIPLQLLAYHLSINKNLNPDTAK